MSQSLFNKNPSNSVTVAFMVILSVSCALILALLASALEKPKEIAKELDRSKQMMIAARILNPDGYFEIQDEEGNYIPAKYSAGGLLIPGTIEDIPSREQLVEIYTKRLKPYLVDKEGNLRTFAEAHIDENDYISKFRKKGYYTQPLMLLYQILPNVASAEKDHQVEGYVIPVNGYGLWDAIYGYLAIDPDGNTVIGISWYDQKETPGLGANIAEPYWQSLFPGKHIFQESADGKTNFKSAPLGITVVRGKVSEVLGNSPKALSAVDGMAGATLTGNGVTEAYKDVLAPYRPFLIRIHDANESKSKSKDINEPSEKTVGGVSYRSNMEQQSNFSCCFRNLFCARSNE